MTDKKAPPENTDAWIPDDVGDSLQGEVIDVDSAWSDWRARGSDDPEAGWYPLLTIKQDGTGAIVKLHGFRTVLFNELIKREPIPGERIIVTYLGAGEEKEKGKNPAEVYRVTVPGRPPEQTRRIYQGMRRGRVAPGSGVAEPATAEAAGVREPAPEPNADEKYGATLPE